MSEKVRLNAKNWIADGKAIVAALTLYCLLVGLLFYDTLSSMVSIWSRSQTFAHGFLILPISLWLAWRLRKNAGHLTIIPEPRVLLLILTSGLAWLFAHTVDVLVLQQLSFVAVLVFGIWAVVGNRMALYYAFPLGFLFLAVPMGAGLIPPLMKFTADTTEFLLQVSGIPVFREGMYLTLATGTWSVIEECSGVRYLIASFTLGLLYAYLSYDSLLRRAAFVALAIVLPILANSVRAYSVVIVGHLSERRLGMGDDHLVYGWIFFGLVMLLMFWIGGFWQQGVNAPVSSTESSIEPVVNNGYSIALTACLALLCASAWPAIAGAMERNSEPVDSVALSVPERSDNWQAIEGESWGWRPAQHGSDRKLDRYYGNSDQASATIGLHLRQYLQQRQGAELVSSDEPWRPDRIRWRVTGSGHVLVDLGPAARVHETRVASAHHDLLVWSWYRIDGRNTSSSLMAKLLEARQKLFDGRRQGSRVFFVTSTENGVPQARKALRSFVSDYYQAIENSLDTLVRDQATSEGPAYPGATE